jgi:acyl-coenzyme A thioesterase 13
MNDIPPGFTPLFRSSPFLEMIGPFYQRREGDGLIIGLRVAAHHTNTRGRAHGGLLMTMADIALGYNAAFLGAEKAPGAVPTALLTTVNLSIDFVGSARLGDWVEVRVDIQKVGHRLAFANAYLSVGSERIARASAVFVVSSQETLAHPGEKE